LREPPGRWPNHRAWRFPALRGGLMPADPDRALTNAELLEQVRDLASEINFRLES
jgi:hypothetical protein